MFKGRFFAWLGYAVILKLSLNCLFSGNLFWGVIGVGIALVGISDEIKLLK